MLFRVHTPTKESWWDVALHNMFVSIVVTVIKLIVEIKMDLDFTDEQLQQIKQIADANGEWGLREAFYWWCGVERGQQVQVDDVEDFSIAFMTKYNERFGVTY
jgi:hypothetical protein